MVEVGDAIRDLIVSKDTDWGSTIRVSASIPARFAPEALATWAGALEAYAGRLVDIAIGVTAMRGESDVSKADMEDAIKLFNKGIEKVLDVSSD